MDNNRRGNMLGIERGQEVVIITRRLHRFFSFLFLSSPRRRVVQTVRGCAFAHFKWKRWLKRERESERDGVVSVTFRNRARGYDKDPAKRKRTTRRDAKRHGAFCRVYVGVVWGWRVEAGVGESK